MNDEEINMIKMNIRLTLYYKPVELLSPEFPKEDLLPTVWLTEWSVTFPCIYSKWESQAIAYDIWNLNMEKGGET